MKKFVLLKSKDDFSNEHYLMSPMAQLTGFTGTAGEAIQDETGKITLFVDPRYHIQSEIETKGKNVNIVKMSGQYDFVSYLKKFLYAIKDNNNSNEDILLSIPEKSTKFSFYEKLKNNLVGININSYNTINDTLSIDNDNLNVFSVNFEIAGKSPKEKVKEINKKNFLITNLEQIAYILNLRSFKTKNTSTFRAKLFIEDNKSAILFCDYEIPKTLDFIEIKPLNDYENYIKNIESEILIDLNSISLYDYNLLKNPVNIEKNPVIKLMSVKNNSEINHYKDSFKRLDAALFGFREQIKEGLSEFELNQIFEKELIKNGAKTTSFKTILAIDENSSIIHYTANSKQKCLKKESLILLDCGGYYEGGYATDITRVFACSNVVKNKAKEIYTAVLRAQLNVYHSNLLLTDELHNLAAEILKKYEPENFYFPHGLGHGVGIAVHEAPPTLSNKIKQKIENFNVFTIEPGLYKEGEFGVRLENTVYLKDNKKYSLSHFPYEDILIDYSLLNENEKKWLKTWQEFY